MAMSTAKIEYILGISIHVRSSVAECDNRRAASGLFQSSTSRPIDIRERQRHIQRQQKIDCVEQAQKVC